MTLPDPTPETCSRPGCSEPADHLPAPHRDAHGDELCPASLTPRAGATSMCIKPLGGHSLHMWQAWPEPTGCGWSDCC